MMLENNQKMISQGVGYLTASALMSLARYFRIVMSDCFEFESFFFLGATGGLMVLL